MILRNLKSQWSENGGYAEKGENKGHVGGEETVIVQTEGWRVAGDTSSHPLGRTDGNHDVPFVSETHVTR